MMPNSGHTNTELKFEDKSFGWRRKHIFIALLGKGDIVG